MKRIVNRLLSQKRFANEVHILDGIIISMLLIFFVVKNFATLSKIYFVDLTLLLFMVITVFLITVLTIKNVIWNIDDIQISLAFMVSFSLTLFNHYFFTGMIAFWFFFTYFLVFTVAFFRNFIMKVYIHEKKISW